MTPAKLREYLSGKGEQAAQERVRALRYIHDDGRTRRRRDRRR